MEWQQPWNPYEIFLDVARVMIASTVKDVSWMMVVILCSLLRVGTSQGEQGPDSNVGKLVLEPFVELAKLRDRNSSAKDTTCTIPRPDYHFPSCLSLQCLCPLTHLLAGHVPIYGFV